MDDFAERLADATPTPGGGAAAARVGVYACSLIRMVTGITLKKIAEGKVPTTPDVPRIALAQTAAIELSQRFSRLEIEDMAAFQSYLDALRLPRSSDEEKARRLHARQQAAWRATQAPLDTLRAALEALGVCQTLIELSKSTPLKAESDLGAAVELAQAVFRVAQLNIRVNLSELSDEHGKLAVKEWERLKAQMEPLYRACSAPFRAVP